MEEVHVGFKTVLPTWARMGPKEKGVNMALRAKNSNR